MRRITKFLRLPASDRRLLFQSWCLLIWTTVLLRLMPYSRLQQQMEKQRTRERLNPPAVEKLTWAVHLAGNYVPKATCLPQALVTFRLLRTNGYPARLVLGVKKDGEDLLGHAWVENEGQVVIGGPSVDAYTALKL